MKYRNYSVDVLACMEEFIGNAISNLCALEEDPLEFLWREFKKIDCALADKMEEIRRMVEGERFT